MQRYKAELINMLRVPVGFKTDDFIKIAYGHAKYGPYEGEIAIVIYTESYQPDLFVFYDRDKQLGISPIELANDNFFKREILNIMYVAGIINNPEIPPLSFPHLVPGEDALQEPGRCVYYQLIKPLKRYMGESKTIQKNYLTDVYNNNNGILLVDTVEIDRDIQDVEKIFSKAKE